MVIASLLHYLQHHKKERNFAHRVRLRALVFNCMLASITILCITPLGHNIFGQEATVRPLAPPPPPTTMPSPPLPTVSETIVAPIAPASPQSAPLLPPSPPLTPEVITIVHRLSGWKLATWFAWTDAELTNRFSSDFVHTKIVAGCVLGDGRTIVARLPQAEIEARARLMPQRFQNNENFANGLTDDLTVIRRSGERQRLNFIGLDGRTGLSLLEILPSAAQPFPTTVNGVHRPTAEVSAVPIHNVQSLSTSASPEASTTASSYSPVAEIFNTNSVEPIVGQRVRLLAPEPVRAAHERDVSGVVRLRINQVAGRITRLDRAPLGGLARITLSTETFSPSNAGAVAIDEIGTLIGIVEHGGDGGEVRLLPVAEIRRATERVLARRASVPQPWLGARGDAVALAGLERLLANGWRQERARALLDSQQGILLTAIAPNTPAANAGLRPGDVIVRVGEQLIRGVEDFSFMLREAGENASLLFRIIRALEEEPRDVVVRLSETLNPARATELAMTRATTIDAAATAAVAARRMQRTAATRGHVTALGLESVALPAKIAEQFGARRGSLLVVAVRPDTDAARSGLRIGDLIESVNNRGLQLQNYNTAFQTAQRNSPLMLTVVRDGQRVQLLLQQTPSVTSSTAPHPSPPPAAPQP